MSLDNYSQNLFIRSLDGLLSLEADTVQTTTLVINGSNVNLADLFNKVTDTSDAITEGSVKLFLTTTERANIAANTAKRHDPVTIGTSNGLSVGGTSGQELSLGLAGFFTNGAITNTTYIDIQVNKAARHPALYLVPGAENGLVLGTSQDLSMNTASSTQTGTLTSTDWNTFNNKQDTIIGAATTITTSNLTASRALVSDLSGKVSASNVTSTELGFVSGVTSNIQTQLNALAGSGVWTTNTTPTPNVVRLTHTGLNVAIGDTNVPTTSTRLWVNGTARVTDMYVPNSLSVDTNAYFGSLGSVTSDRVQIQGGLRTEGGNVTIGTGELRVGSSGSYVAGKLGIGYTSVPSTYQLDVSGTSRITSTLDVGGNTTAPDFSIQRFNPTLSKSTHAGQWWGIAQLTSTALGKVTIEYSNPGNHSVMELEFGVSYGQSPFVHLVNRTGYGVFLVESARIALDPSSLTDKTHRLEIFLTASANWHLASYDFTFKLKAKGIPTATPPVINASTLNLYSSIETGTSGWTYYYWSRSFTSSNDRYHDVSDTGSHWFRTNAGNNIRQVIKPAGNPLEIYDNAGYGTHRYQDTLLNANLDVGCGYNTASSIRAEVKCATANGRLDINSGQDGLQLNYSGGYPIYMGGPLYMYQKYFYKNFAGYMLINTGTTGSFFANTVTGSGMAFVNIQCLAKGNGGGGALYMAIRRNYSFLTGEGQITQCGFRGSGNWNNFSFSGVIAVGTGDVIDVRYVNDTNPYEINEIGITVYVI